MKPLAYEKENERSLQKKLKVLKAYRGLWRAQAFS